VVDPQRLDPGAADGVGGDVERERPAGAESVAALGPEHQTSDPQVPDRLVEKRRLVGRDLRGVSGPVGRVDPYRPRQRRGPAVELLVEVVAQPADRLGDRQRRRQHVGYRSQADPPPSASDPRPQGAGGDRAPDAQTSAPEVERLDGMLAGGEVQLRVGHHVVDPRADDPERHRPQGHVAHHPRLAAAGAPAPFGQRQRGDDPGDDAQRVGPHRQRADMPHPLGGARQVGQDVHPTASIRVRRPHAISVTEIK